MGGIDKSALDVGGSTILDRVRAALATTCDRVLIVGREKSGGPAAAVGGIREELADVDLVVVLAGDLALVRAEHVEALVDAAANADAAAALDDRGLPNPLVAAYRAAALLPRLEEVGSGDRADRLLPANTRVVQLDDDATFNVNTREDLETARLRLSR